MFITTAVGLGYPSPCGRTSVGLREHETTLGKRVFNGDLEAPRLRSGPHENFFLAFSRFRPKNFWATASASTLMGRLRRPEPQGTLTPNRRHSICAIERTTPGGTARSPLQYRQERTPQAESHTARKRRLDRNRQAANYGMKRAARDDGSCVRRRESVVRRVVGPLRGERMGVSGSMTATSWPSGQQYQGERSELGRA
jgi:hypothetical protein